MSTFQFKHFAIKQSVSAMKVGTDAMLLGSMAGQSGLLRILDVGTGTGVIALMLAQRFTDALISAVEIERSAYEEARGNIASSSFSDRVNISHCDFIDYEPKEKYDLIVSNPPFFVNSLKNAEQSKILARHADHLSASQFLKKAIGLLEVEGSVQVIIPNDLVSSWEAAGFDVGLSLTQKTMIQGKPSTEVNRAILTFDRRPSEQIVDLFIIRNDDNTYSEDYIKLTSEFHDRIPK